jgi:cyclic pyranopterin phosphate synthase
VAKLFRLPGAKGNIGLISPVSAHFCAACNRIRITADGKVKPCLHSSEEISIKGMDLEEMEQAIRRAILEKPQWHGELSYSERSRANRNMNQIGG